MAIKIYEYAGCSTCKNALKYLDARKKKYEKVTAMRLADARILRDAPLYNLWNLRSRAIEGEDPRLRAERGSR